MEWKQKVCPNCGCGNFGMSHNTDGMVCQDCGAEVD